MMTSATPSTAGRRPEIQGLRALCMAQVLVYHAWRIGSPVGVDAFITISAYLMTESFLRRTEAGTQPTVLGRWTATFRRLLPPLVVVVLATVGAGMLVLPQTRWPGLVRDGLASVLYVQNWNLATQAADYFAQNHAGASPLQHLWSMSMQGQVFLLWPALMACCAATARRVGRRPRQAVSIAFALLAVASLAWLLAAPHDASVYFDTRARIWEFALGALVAALAPLVRVGHRTGATLLVLALAILGVYFTVPIGSYPGPMAAAPMLAVSVVLLVAPHAPGGATALLSARPLVAIGDMSYSVYLVHWPVYVLFLAAVGHDALGTVDGLALIAVALVLAWLLDRVVDRRGQRQPRHARTAARRGTVIALALTLGLAPLAGAEVWIGVEQARLREAAAATAGAATSQATGREPAPVDPQHPGANALVTETSTRFTVAPVPAALAVSGEWVPGIADHPCPATLAAALSALHTSCGETGPSQGKPTRVWVVGDSHAEQTIVPIARELARRNGWRARSVLTGGCAFGASRFFGGPCGVRNKVILDELRADPPDILMVQSTMTSADSPREIPRPGLEEVMPTLQSLGITVIGVRDNVRSSKDLYECSSKRSATKAIGGCLLPRATHLAATDPAVAFDRFPAFHAVDPTDLYCTATVCPTIIGNVFAYIDGNHLSATFSRTMAPILADRVEAIVAKARRAAPKSGATSPGR